VTNSGVVSGVNAGNVTVSALDSNSEPGYSSDWCEQSPWSCPQYYTQGGNASAQGTVGDDTPSISGISPGTWNAGATTAVTITGQHFGTNAPTLNFSPSGGISYSLSPGYSDTQIVANITVANSVPNESVSVTVTNNGYNGNGFIGAQGQNPTSSSAQADVNANPVPVNFKLASVTAPEGTLGLVSTYTWQSSDGVLTDLSSCSMREYVTYPSSTNKTCPGNSPPQQCYYPNSPPWAGSGSGYTYPNPTSPPPGSATGGKSSDTNAVLNLNFVKPYKADSFQATQYIQYSCKGGAWTNLYGPRTITRSVSQSGSTWSAKISTSDSTTTNTYTLP